MARVINQLYVCETSTFSGESLFLADLTIDAANIVMNTSTGSLTIDASTQTGAGVAQFPDMGATTDTFVFEDLAQTLTNKYIVSPRINQIRDTGNNIALNICDSGETDSDALNHFQLCGTTGDTISLEAVGSSANINICLDPKGSGYVKLKNLVFPTGTGANGQVLQTDGNGNLSFVTTLTPSEATMETNAGSPTVYFDMGTVEPNSVQLFNARLVGVSEATNDDVAGAFIIKTAYARGQDGDGSLHAVGSPVCDDVVKFLDDSEWNVMTRVKPSDSAVVQLCVTGDLTDTVLWKLTTQAIDISTA